MKYLLLICVLLLIACKHDQDPDDPSFELELEINGNPYNLKWKNATESSKSFYVEATDDSSHFGILFNKNHQYVSMNAEYSTDTRSFKPVRNSVKINSTGYYEGVFTGTLYSDQNDSVIIKNGKFVWKE